MGSKGGNTKSNKAQKKNAKSKSNQTRTKSEPSNATNETQNETVVATETTTQTTEATTTSSDTIPSEIPQREGSQDEINRILPQDSAAEADDILLGTKSNYSDSDDDEETEEPSKSVVTTAAAAPGAPKLTFSDIGVAPWICDQLNKLQIVIPTVIQEKCIPAAIAGKNVIGMSETGSGKTASFAIPILQALAKDVYGPFALVLTPTRELAFQIEEHFKILGRAMPSLRIEVVTGGKDYLRQSKLLELKPHIIIGTLGRIEAMIRMYNLDYLFKKIKYLVFDEADRILSDEFGVDLEKILEVMNPKRQTLLYSATMNKQVKRLAQLALQNDPDNLFIFDACKLYKTADTLSQKFIFMPKVVKDCYLVHVLKAFQEKKKLVVVFFTSLRDCELLMQTCRRMGISCDSLHAVKALKERVQALQDFRNKKALALFSTDVGNRGLDIPAVAAVINYDLPRTTKDFIHRVGRTARAGRAGLALSLISQNEIQALKDIEKDTGVTMTEYQVDEKAAEDMLYDVAEHRCHAKIAMLKSGFEEVWEEHSVKQELSRVLKAKGKVYFEKKMVDSLADWKTKKQNKNKSSNNKNNAEESTSQQQQQNKQKRAREETADDEHETEANDIGGVSIFGSKKSRKLTA